MASFRKQEDCPTSEELLAFQHGDLETADSRRIGRHLGGCEFCAAEVQFYERYPVSADADECPTSAAKMPKPLFDLAEALLNRKRGEQSIDELMKELDAMLHEQRR